MPAFKDITGQTFGRLAVIERTSPTTDSGRKRVMWRCSCECGNQTKVDADHLRTGHTTSCGCVKKSALGNSSRTHGLSKTHPLYDAWCKMRSRCSSPKDARWSLYGQRGIRVCERWTDFAAFAIDMSPRPIGNYSLERIDNNGNYEPGNCKWATQREQCRNKRTNRIFLINGNHLCLRELADKSSVKYNTIRARLNRGWTIERALLA